MSGLVARLAGGGRAMRSHSPTVALETELREGLAPELAASRAQSALRGGDVGARVAAFYLADLADRRGYLELGHPTLKHFARHRLRLPVSTARNLIATGRALRSLPEIDAGFASDRLTWTHVKVLVTIATPETDRAWANWAATHTTRELERQVARREKGDLPTAPERRTIHEPRQRVGADLTPTRYEVWRRAREKLEAACGERLTDQDMMMEVAQWILRMRPDGSVPGWRPVNDRHYLLHAWPRGAPGREGLSVATIGEEGEEVTIDLRELTAGLERRPSDEPGVVDPKQEDAAVLDPANGGSLVPAHLRAPATSPALRDEVLGRDGYQCRCCGSRERLTVHHLVWRSYGGRTERSNLLSVCEPCHALIHARLLIALGDPEGALRFLDRTGRPVEQVPLTPVELHFVPAAAKPASELVDLDRLPPEVDTSWWARHEHLLSWNERQGELMLTPGAPRELEDGAGAASKLPLADRSESSGLDALVGQSAVRERLALAIAAAGRRGEPLRSLLFVGPPGLGKSSFARAVAAELGAPLAELPAPHLRTPDALVRALASLRRGGVLFVDELHAIPPRAAEVLYEALDRGTVSLPVRQGLRMRTVRLRLAPLTLVGATTDPDRLPRPLLGRLRVLRLEPYGTGELATIVSRASRRAGLELTPAAAEQLARASRETPRGALALLGTVRDEAAVEGVTTVDERLVERALRREQVDAVGLDGIERAYVRELQQSGRPLGLGTLAARLDVSEEALRTIHEPILVRRGLVEITPLGRVLAAPADAIARKAG
ncbi:MAG: AAA family ATPase [Planctomycetes bacterium]|nr:AAA family ATPase [Planctomycetota bacterium]